MKARDIMTQNPECLTADEPLSRAAQLMRDSDVGLIPVVHDAGSRRLRGVITDRDIAVRHVAEQHHDDCEIASHMSDGPTSIGPDASLDEVLRVMGDRQIRRVPVVENEKLIGIISQADLATKAGRDNALEVERTIEQISEPKEARH